LLFSRQSPWPLHVPSVPHKSYFLGVAVSDGGAGAGAFFYACSLSFRIWAPVAATSDGVIVAESASVVFLVKLPRQFW